MKSRIPIGCGVICSLVLLTASAQTRRDANLPHLERRGGVTRLIVDGKPFIMLGGQVGNRSGTPERMAQVWPKLKAYSANTVEFPVYWNLLEPEEGKYDFSVSDQVIRDCRAQGLRAVLLWFASNKCGRPQNYPPKWVLSDTKRFPRIMDAGGKPAEPMSLHAETTLEVERNAYRAFMQHLKEVDGADHTVILMQVENEPGLLGHARDYSPEATRLLNAAVPSALAAALHKKPGTWKEVFGPRAAEEASTAYDLATYINKLAKAGKEVYPLPTYVNVWMGGSGTNDRFYDFDRPGPSYPSGGPVSHMIELWKAAAPDIYVIAPDIYHRSAVIYRTILSRYTRRDNPLLIVETGQGMPFARYCFSVLVDYSGIGFAQYGVDQGSGRNALSDQFTDVGADFRLIGNAMPVITQLQGTDKLKSAIEEEFISGRELNFDRYDILVKFPPAMNRRPGSPEPALPSYTPAGRTMIAQTAPDEFLIMGFNSAIDFKPALGSGQENAKFTLVEDGSFEDGVWKASATRDPGSAASDLKLSAEGAMVKVKLARY